ncbi:MAG TPA: monofunctional biosynthetic peptidoglycan transglycosylase [Devosia sp.]|nr:monofunctional biosynthetic peptidoglycan transglycosylase [Devosia sp.]
MGKNKRHPVVVWGRRGLAALVFVFLVPVVLVPLYWVVKPISVPMAWRYLTGQNVSRTWVDIDQVSDRLKVSVMLSEDGQFCRHWGVDIRALQIEIEAVLDGRPARGASTLSMQLARNLFLWNGRSFIRKGLEIPLAFYLDLVLSKRRIMEIYLNIAEWGPDGEFGIEAGVQKAFGVDGDALSWRRATLMAVALPNPLVRLPATPSPGLVRVARRVEQRAKQYSDRAWCLFENGVPELD